MINELWLIFQKYFITNFYYMLCKWISWKFMKIILFNAIYKIYILIISL